MARLIYLSADDTVFVAEELAKSLFPGTPDFQLIGPDHGRGLLESALAQPRWPQHRRLQDKAAVLLWHVILNHPYLDGNKRVGIAALTTFLLMNGAILVASTDELMNLALRIAGFDPPILFEECRRFLRRRCLRRDWSLRQIQRWVLNTPAAKGPLVRAAIIEFLNMKNESTHAIRFS